MPLIERRVSTTNSCVGILKTSLNRNAIALSAELSSSDGSVVFIEDSESLRSRRLLRRREKKKQEKLSYVSLNGDRKHMFRQSPIHYLHQMEKHPERDIEFTKIIE